MFALYHEQKKTTSWIKLVKECINVN
jgi:hypothetical protein